MSVIVTTLAGREDRMTVLLQYIKKAMELKIIDEYHIWDFATSQYDSAWLDKITELYSTPADIFTYFRPQLSLNKLSHLALQVKTNLTFHLKIYNFDQSQSLLLIFNPFKISIGDDKINNSNNFQEFNFKHNILSNTHFSDFFIFKQNNNLKIQHNDAILVEYPIEIEWDHFYVSSRDRAEWIFNDEERPIKLFKCLKQAPHWEEYYTHYSTLDKLRANDVFIQINDGIVYLDLNHLQNFIDFRVKNPEYFVVSANIINQDLSTKIQKKYGMLNPSLFSDNIIKNINKSGIDAEKLHRYFIHNYDDFILKNKNSDLFLDNDFLLVKEKFKPCLVSWLGGDCQYMHNFNAYHEEQMTIQIPQKIQRNNAIFLPFIASYLANYNQENQMDTKDLIYQYQCLLDHYFPN